MEPIEQLASNIEQFSRNVRTLETKIKVLKTNDTKDNRREILQLVADTTELARITESSCRRVDVKHMDTREQIQHSRLMKALRDYMTKFQSLQQTAAEIEQEALDRASAAGSPIAHPSPFREPIREEPHSPSLTPQVYRQVQASATEDEEQAAAVRQLESNINDIRTIFKDLAAMVHEQGEVVEQIDEKTDIAATRVESGNQNLVQAAKYKRCSNRLTCCIVCIVTTVVVVVVIAVLIVVLIVKKIIS